MIELLRGNIPEIREPLVRDFKAMKRMVKVPLFLLPYVIKVYKMMGEGRETLFIKAYQMSSTYSTMHITNERKRLVEEVIDRISSQGVEVLLFYGLPLPATLHDRFEKTFLLSTYSSIFNFLNFPVGTVPVTKVKQGE